MKCSFYEEGLRAITINFPRTKRIPLDKNIQVEADHRQFFCSDGAGEDLCTSTFDNGPSRHEINFH